MYKIGDEMHIKISPNRWSCVPYAFATAIDADPTTLIELLQHDGSEIIFPHLEEPLCRRGFTCPELSMVLWGIGYLVGCFDYEPTAMVDKENWYTVKYPNADKLFESIMANSLGVVLARIKGTDTTHATAWNGEKCFDPMGFIYPISRYEIYSYYPIVRLE